MKNPLSLSIFWHPGCSASYQLAEKLYSFYLRNSQNALDRYLGIPVNMYPDVPQIKEIEWDTSLLSIQVLLVGDKFMDDSGWVNFSQKLVDWIGKPDKGKHLVVPVAITQHAARIHAFKDLEIIGFSNRETPYRRDRDVLIRLTHQICKWIQLGEEVTPPDDSISLFLSHAQKDGENVAQLLKNHMVNATDLGAFFDTNTIRAGARFAEVLKRKAEKAILLVIHSDVYSSREECRQVVLMAKMANCPIVVINRFQEGEYRSFPYMGNVPHMHYATSREEELNDPLFLDFIILEALRELLKTQYNALRSDILLRAFQQKAYVLKYPPELLTLQEIDPEETQWILYPDPPLGRAELDLLEAFRPNLSFITPTSLPLVLGDNYLSNPIDTLKVGISLSESGLTNHYWVKNRALENVMVELSRYLLVSGIHLIYSGDLKYEAQGNTSSTEKPFNFAVLLAELVETYQKTYDHTDTQLKALTNYSFYPLYDCSNPQDRSRWSGSVEFIPIPPPDYLQVGKAEAKSMLAYDDFNKRYVWAKSLSAMRQAMMAEEASDVWIILGGKWTGFKGRMSGVLEEFITAKENGKPIFLLGGFGGVSKGISDALQGIACQQLSLNFYQENYPAYYHFLSKYNDNEWTEPVEKVHYPRIQEKLKKQGNQGEDFGLGNGLSKAENLRLFSSKNEFEIIQLILKGLKEISTT